MAEVASRDGPRERRRLIRAVLGRPKRKAGEGERSEARGYAGGLARGKRPAGQNEEGEKIIFLNTFSNLIFKLNLNSIQILVKANHYKNKCAAA